MLKYFDITNNIFRLTSCCVDKLCIFVFMTALLKTLFWKYSLTVFRYTERFPKPGESVRGKRLTVGCGGKGANQAVAAARLGARVAMVGKVREARLWRMCLEKHEYGALTKQASAQSKWVEARSFQHASTFVELNTVDTFLTLVSLTWKTLSSRSIPSEYMLRYRSELIVYLQHSFNFVVWYKILRIPLR